MIYVDYNDVETKNGLGHLPWS